MRQRRTDSTDGQTFESRTTIDTGNCVAGEGAEGATRDILRFPALTDVPRHSANEIPGNGHQRDDQAVPTCTIIWAKTAEGFRCR